jgi:hypothetical protein
MVQLLGSIATLSMLLAVPTGSIQKKPTSSARAAKKEAHDKVLQRACDAGTAAACMELGTLYDSGRGVRKNHELAAPLLDRACEMKSEMCSLIVRDSSLSLDLRLVALAKVQDPGVLAEIARTGADVPLRKAATERVTDPAALEQVAKTDADAEVRRSARRGLGKSGGAAWNKDLRLGWGNVFDGSAGARVREFSWAAVEMLGLKYEHASSKGDEVGTWQYDFKFINRSTSVSYTDIRYRLSWPGSRNPEEKMLLETIPPGGQTTLSLKSTGSLGSGLSGLEILGAEPELFVPEQPGTSER